MYSKLHSPYPAYRDIEGTWSFSAFALKVVRVQSDPFAPPTRLRISLTQAQHGWPNQLHQSPIRRIALADWLTRRLAGSIQPRAAPATSNPGGGWHGTKGGDFSIDRPGEQVLERSSCKIDSTSGEMTVRLSMNLPARGRSILGQLAADLLYNQLSDHIHRSIIFTKLLEAEATDWVKSVEDQDALRQLATKSGMPHFTLSSSQIS